ncbi:MAG TPA: hypothetical protein VEU98_00435, partial [Candidatus Eremiobacteraceae bacterium]|nr:hypothetical protein [Candidatus Eremiobacteraceae bacterium]
MTKSRIGFFFSFLVALALSAAPVFANGVKADLGASGRGTVNPPGGCAANFATNPECVDFSTSGALPVWTAFEANNSDPNNIIITNTTGPENLFVVSGISSITFQLLGNANFGSFLCGSQSNMSDLLNGDCTNIVDPVSLLGIDPPADLSAF